MEIDEPHFTGAGFIESFDSRYPTRILDTLLKDRTTGRNIIWADDEYEALGDGYMGDDEITVEKITGLSSGVIKPRIAKKQEHQSKRTKTRAEVFTPSWLCNRMNNDIDATWFGARDVFNVEDGVTWHSNPKQVVFPKKKGHGWHAYVESPRLEITCGEAPFVCSRYDTVTGDALHSLPSRPRTGSNIRATTCFWRASMCSRRTASIFASAGVRECQMRRWTRLPGLCRGTSGR